MNEASATRRLLLLCHHGGFEELLQATSAAAAASGSGWQVDLVFYFEALQKLIEGRLDDVEGEVVAWSEDLSSSVDESGVELPSRLLEAARSAGSTRVFACSASLRLLGREAAQRPSVVDEVVGWPTVLQLLQRSERVLYL